MNTKTYIITENLKKQNMQDKTKTTANDGGKSLGNVAESGNDKQNSPLVKRTQIGNSPLVVVGSEEQGWVVALGNYKITEVKNSETEAYEELQGENKWNTICNLITTIAEVAKEHERIETVNEKQLRLQLEERDKEVKENDLSNRDSH